MKKTLFISTALFLASNVFAQTTQPLTVYTYDTFSADWSTGPKVKAGFEKQFPQCQLNYVAFDNSGTLFNRVRLDGKKIKADIVLGLDNYQIDEAKKLAIFEPNQVDLNKLDLPLKWDDRTFLPFDFAKYAFIYDKNKLSHPPKSLKELVERKDLKVLYQDPRTSSIGRGLLLWVNTLYPQAEAQNVWKTLSEHTVTITKGWTEAYGAFLKGEGDLVLSTNTSPIYHLLSEQKDNYMATDFSEGGILLVEVAAKVANRHNACADFFLDYLVSPEAQANIAKHNVMLPIIDSPIESHIDALKKHTQNSLILDTSKITGEQLKIWINQWQKALSK
ncbi:thiamine ABC transporter substrate binding subunit [Rodentibacter trehalosifermentans]|uniref:Thiamine ABC transporter substrate binding subunit n=1 Tax=Rodentibacter trehalosifermentans TaxID=1908263 RepID=A0A1V3ITW8_9PAST|nr:thiamine ABC transporter substrate binding subunit [Rodentibacter trehalosifermentans]OOF45541.1 thiamine ABC transporter substrate binding subunit [Rodentibacter trehalosifermentans]OOF52753.1 thiamine ABC transporter substrate binding subunit [Rodentibacter trehalosifermentans]